jgi:hypothetical protein
VAPSASAFGRGRRAIGLAALFAAIPACASDVEPSPFGPRKVVVLARQAVLTRDGRTIGEIVDTRIEDPREPVRYWRARNAHGQDLGAIDRQGRVYRRKLFAETEEFVGVYPMEQALEILFEVPSPRLGRIELTEPKPR